MTRKTAVILDYINSSKCHPTAEEIYLDLRAENIPISLATVYNGLNILLKNGQIKKLSYDGKSDRFDNMKPHDHLICAKCGKITDFFTDDITDELKKITHKNIISYDFNIYYFCENCEDK